MSEELVERVARAIFREHFAPSEQPNIIGVKWFEWAEDRKRCFRFARAAMSVLTPSPQWQDIATAPKDGAVILYWPAIDDLPEHIAVCSHRGGPFRHPTHWMPTPCSPSTGGGS